MKINRAYKFRTYPNPEQKTLLDKTFGSCRFLWNQMLDERKKFYEANKDDKETLYNHTYKTEAEYKKEYDFLSEVVVQKITSCNYLIGSGLVNRAEFGMIETVMRHKICLMKGFPY